MKRMTLGASAAVLMLAGAAFAAEEQSQAMHPEMTAETRVEAQTRAGLLFDKLDLNHDGKLDQADRAARMAQMFDRIDTNHDGVISRSEFAAAHEHMMRPGHGPDGMGMNGDHPGGPDGNDDHPGGPDGRMAHPGGGHGHMGHWGYDRHQLDGLLILILHRADPAHTGTVTRDAFVKAALSLFDQADTNHDGVLTPAEHRAFAQAMRQQMHADWGKRGSEHHGEPGGDMPPPGPPPPPASPN